MPGPKTPEVIKLEQSLIQYLCQKSEVDERVPGGFRRVRSLSFYIDASNPQRPTFSVQIGMLEVTFNAMTGMREKGNCYGIERYIIDWFLRPSISAEIMQIARNQSKKSN